MSIESFTFSKKPGYPAKLYLRFTDAPEIRVNLETLIEKEVFTARPSAIKKDTDNYIAESLKVFNGLPDTDSRKEGLLLSAKTPEFKKNATNIVTSRLTENGKKKSAKTKLNSIVERMTKLVNEIYEEVK